MLLVELVKVLRVQYLDDVAEPYLWRDPELVSYIIQAQDEACERAKLIIDETTPEICEIPVQKGVMGYSLDDRVIIVKRAAFGTSRSFSYALKGPITRQELDETHPGWHLRPGQVASFICEDNGEITFAPPSREDGTAYLQVSRYPLNRLTLNSTAGSGTAGLGITYPEVPSRYHLKMLDWAAHLAFLKNDSETFNIAKADKYEASFERKFGKPVSAKTQRFMRSNNLNRPRMKPRILGS